MHTIERGYHTRGPTGYGNVCHWDPTSYLQTGRHAKQVCYADDTAAGSSIENLKRWWDLLVEIGPLYGYFPNGSSQHVEAAREIFKDTGIIITTEGERYLEGAIGSPSFVRQLVEQKVECWRKELEKLGKLAENQPHAVFAAFTHGLHSKWTYLLRIIDWEENQLDDTLESRESDSVMSHPSTHWAISSRETHTKVTSSTCKTWWSGSDHLSERTASCFCPTSRPNHQSRPSSRRLPFGAAEYQEKDTKHTKQNEAALQSLLPAPLQRSMELAQADSTPY